MGRRLGQHFLARPSVLERIAEAACPDNQPLVVEIGPGRGALTGPLLSRAERVVAIELDPILIQYLREKFREPIESGKLELVEADVLKVDLGAWGPCAIAGNLPYYITSPILERIFASNEQWSHAVLLIQSEVADRLAALPGSRDFGYLSVTTQVRACVERIIDVPRAAFRPPPKVDSAVVQLEPRDAQAAFGIADVPAFLEFASVCFRHKRKTLRNNLIECYSKDRVDRVFAGTMRAEQMGITELARLWEKLKDS